MPSRGGVADIVDVGGVVVAVVVVAVVVVVVVVVFRCYRRPSSSDVTDVLLSILFITPRTYMQDGLGWAGLSRTGLGWACRSWAGLGRAGLEHTKTYRKPVVVMVGIHGGFAWDLRGIQRGFVSVWGDSCASAATDT